MNKRSSSTFYVVESGVAVALRKQHDPNNQCRSFKTERTLQFFEEDLVEKMQNDVMHFRTGDLHYFINASDLVCHTEPFYRELV